MRRWLPVAVLLAACSSFGENVAAPPPGATPDGGADASDASATVDATVPPVDRSPVPGFCASAKAFTDVRLCDDFDQPARPNTKGDWDLIDEGEQTAPLKVAMPAGGTSLALHLFYANRNGASRDVLLMERPGYAALKDARRISLEYKFFPANVELQFARSGALFHWTADVFRHPYGMGFWNGDVEARRGDPRLDIAADRGNSEPWIEHSRNAWHTAKVVIEGENLTAARRVSVVIDDEEVGNDTLDPATIGAFDVILGVWETSKNEGVVDVWYDDVLLRFGP